MRRQIFQLAIFFFLLAAPLFAIHFSLLGLPYFWDEHGQFIPSALDLFRDGTWVAHSTLPNLHPPGVAAYLVLWYKLFGYSIPITRVAMLAMASFGLLLTFLLSVELTDRVRGTPAFVPPALLLVSPIFFTQSMMAQLDMPAMVFTVLALLLFLRERYLLCSVACVALVLAKETGLVTPAVFAGVLVWKRQYKQACKFLMAPAVLGIWLIVLHRATGYWMGNPGFEHYNVDYSVNPVRIVFTALRRVYYLLFAEFRWIGTLVVAITARTVWRYRSPKWAVAGLVFAANFILVIVFGGAALERYLLPVLPLYFIVVSVGLWSITKHWRAASIAALVCGLAGSIFLNPPYPFPYENNFAMVDFVRLQAGAAEFIESQLPGSRVATAWPYTGALSRPEYGYVERPMKTVETTDFHFSSVAAVPARSFNTLAVYTRTWAPKWGVTRVPWIRQFLQRFYSYEPPISEKQCAQLGLDPVVTWKRRGQEITIYRRNRMPEEHRMTASRFHAADEPQPRN
jgi:4-amino-4-deoxy-L-arabinose transferase-like glycosyltransferase